MMPIKPAPEIEAKDHIHELVRDAYLSSTRAPAFRAFICETFAAEGGRSRNGKGGKLVAKAHRVRGR
jgi:hypothetical protein